MISSVLTIIVEKLIFKCKKVKNVSQSNARDAMNTRIRNIVDDLFQQKDIPDEEMVHMIDCICCKWENNEGCTSLKLFQTFSILKLLIIYFCQTTLMIEHFLLPFLVNTSSLIQHEIEPFLDISEIRFWLVTEPSNTKSPLNTTLGYYISVNNANNKTYHSTSYFLDPISLNNLWKINNFTKYNNIFRTMFSLQ